MLKSLFPRSRDRAILLPAIGAQLILGTTMSLLPVFVDTLRLKAGLSATGAGFLVSAELATASLTTLLLSAWDHAHSVRRWALAGGFLAVMGTLLTLLSPALPNLVASRLVVGIGAGIVGAEAMRVLARGIDRERLIAIVTIASIVNAAILFAVLPRLIDHSGYRGLYFCLLLDFVAGVFLLMRLPAVPVRRWGQKMAGPEHLSLPAIVVVSSVFLTQLGQGAFWSLDGVYGRASGLSADSIGFILALSTLVLLVGASGAAWAGERFGLFPALFFLLATNAVSIVLVGTVPVHWVFVAANILQALTNLSSLIYQLGLSANIDRLGRAVAAATAMVTLGNGVGPGVPAILGSYLTASQIAVLILGIDVIAMGLFSLVLLRWHKGVRRQTSNV